MEPRSAGATPVAAPEAGAGAILRRRWEAELPREEIASLLSEGRLQDLLERLGDARKRWPKDLELLRSVRVLEDHLGVRTTGVISTGAPVVAQAPPDESAKIAKAK